mgnify:CR=1 FL=1
MDNKPLTQRCDYCGAILDSGVLVLMEHVDKEHPGLLKYDPLTSKQFVRMFADAIGKRKIEQKFKNHQRYERRKGEKSLGYDDPYKQ